MTPVGQLFPRVLNRLEREIHEAEQRALTASRSPLPQQQRIARAEARLALALRDAREGA